MLRLPMDEQDQLIWDGHAQGRSARDIGRDLGVNYRAVTRRLKKHGGMRPTQRCRSKGQLRLEEREEISRGLAAGRSSISIASGLGRSASTVSREIDRNGGRDAYRAVDAEKAAWDRARRPKETRLASDPVLRAEVVNGLAEKWSPEQIAGRLRVEHPDEPDRWISYESIYRAVYLPRKNQLPGGIALPLRTGRRVRRSKAHRGGKKQLRGQIKDITLIAERPAEVEDRNEIGHWEGDLVLGTRQSAIATLVERTSRYTEIVKVAGLTSEPVVDAVAGHLSKMPAGVCLSLTWDQGKEMAQHKRLASETGVPIYFCDPKSPWQRGTNENTNGLLRQYFPKRVADLNDYTQADFDRVSDELNDRPRKTLGYRTPREVLAEALRAAEQVGNSCSPHV